MTNSEGTNTMTDDAMRAIEARHQQDAPWFNGGLHDPNGYVAMAHKDRGALLERLQPLISEQAKEAANPTFDALMIPKAAYDWLMGQGPDDQGLHFGDSETSHLTFRGRTPVCWWRTTFRRMCGL